MAQPTITATGTDHSDCDQTTGWDSPTELGSVIMNWDVTQDFVVQGTFSIALEHKSGTGVKGARYNLAAPTDFTVTNRKLQMYLWITSSAIVDVQSGAGVFVYAHDGTDYAQWYVGGSDIEWVGSGWKLISIDLNTTPDYDNATFDPTNVEYVGAGCTFVGALGRADAFAIDMVRHNDLIEVTGNTLYFAPDTLAFDSSANTIVRSTGNWETDGFEIGDQIEVRTAEDSTNDGLYTLTNVATVTLTVADIPTTNAADTTASVEAEFTLQDIINEDELNDTFYGIVIAGDNGAYEMNGNLVVGDVSGALNTCFRMSGETVVWNDNSLGTGLNEIAVAEDTGETRLRIGYSDGAGDAKVGFAGITMFTAPNVYSGVYGLDFSTSITECLIYGSVFQSAEDGITLSASATDNEWISNTITACGEMDPDIAVVRKSFFTSTAAPSTASCLLWGTNINIVNCSFLVNTGTDISAIRHTDGTTSTYYDLLFSGNANDVYLNHADADLTINKDGTSNPSTYRTSGSGTVTFVGTVNLRLIVKDPDGNALVGARCLMEADTGGADPHLVSVVITSVTTTATVDHTAHGLADGEMVNIRGCNQPEYNGAGKVIAWVDVDTYTYTISGGPASPATGSPTATQCYISEVTIAGGIAEESYNAGATQPYRGVVRWSTDPNIWRDVTYSGSDASGGLILPIQMDFDE